MSEDIYTESNQAIQIISRAEAIKLGLKFYFTGKPCKRGHISDIRTNNRDCVVCHKEYQKEYRKEYRKSNTDTIKDYQKEYRKSNTDTIKDYQKTYQKEYHKKNPQLRSEYSRIRNTRLEYAITNWPGESELIKQIYIKRDELNMKWGTQLEVDHIIPINPKDRSVCGLHNFANLQLLDKSLNSSKNDSYKTDW